MNEKTRMNTRLVGLNEFCRDNPQFKKGTMRRFYFENRRNIHSCFVRVGRLLYLDVDRFEAWVLEGREDGSTTKQGGA